MSDLEIREFQVRESEPESRTFSGLAIPWNEVINVGGYKESFERGAFGEFKSTPLFYSHDHKDIPIGVISRGEETEHGYEVSAKLNNSTRANDVYEALKDGSLSKLSIGFKPVTERNEKGVIVRTAVDLKEISIVPFPAYSGALISEVRSENTNKKEAIVADEFAPVADLVEVRESIEDLSRKFDTLDTRSHTAPAPLKFNSLGDFVKRGLAQKEATKEDIDMLVRVYSGDVVADAAPGFAPTWIDNDVHVMQQNRNVLDLFTKKPLPENGMSFTYPSAVTSTGDVAIQAAEGDNLTLIKVVLANASANVATYGAYSDLSRQVIEREPVSYLNEVLDAQKQSYAKVTNAGVRNFLTTSPGSYNTLTMPALASQGNAKAWVDAVLAGTDAIGANSTLGYTADAWLVSSAVFAKIASVYDSTGRPVFVLNGDGANTVGSVNLISQRANIAGLPVIVDRGLTGNVTYMLSSKAINVYEDGSKFLQDQNIVNLTQQFTIYGYLAFAKKDLKAITAVTVPAS